MDTLALILTLVIIIMCGAFVGIFLMLLKIRRSTYSYVNYGQNKLTEQITQTVNSAFGESIKHLTEVANDKLTTTRQATNEDIENKKHLIDLRITDVSKTLDKVQQALLRYDTDSAVRHTKLTTDISNIGVQTKLLTESTNDLNKVLNSSQARGQWGEKMAEDVLQLAGFLEGINYEKQATSDSQLGDGKIRPDFTFMMPDGLKLNMDVKFPLDNYAKYIEADSNEDKDSLQRAFIRDVSNHISTISNKEYIDPTGGTMDYVLMFIPNEGVYEFIYRNDGHVIDSALQRKIIICSPLTMFAILGVIRQSIDNFAISKTSGEILEVLGGFQEQWKRYVAQMDTVERQLITFSKSFNNLKSTRANQLEKSLAKIDELREARGIAALSGMTDPE